jgi:hypothetical protein
MKTISVPPGLRTRRKWIMEKLSGAGTRQHALNTMKTIGWILVALAINVSILGEAGAGVYYNSSGYKWIGDYVVHRDNHNFDSQTPWEEQFIDSYWREPDTLFKDGTIDGFNMAVNGDTLFVVTDILSLEDKIVLTKSFDGGWVWSEMTGPPSPNCYLPVVYQRGNEVWIMARDSQRLEWFKSNDLGESWSIIDTLFYHDASQGYCLAGTTDRLYFLYYLFNNLNQLMLTHWIDSTQNWAEPHEVIRLTFWMPQPIFFKAIGDTLFILCNDRPPGWWEEQFFIKSTDGGLTWSEQMFLSDIDTEHSQEGAMAIDGQRIFVTWFDYKYGSYGGFNGDILGKLSTDGGESWSEEIRLTYNQKGHASSPVVYGNRLNVIWEDLRYRQGSDHYIELSHSYSYDDGVTWSPTELITPSPEKSIVPFAKIDWNSGNIHLAYIDDLGDENGLLYTTGSDFTGIDNESAPPLPESPAILTNYPNPFNSATTINYQLPVDCEVKMVIYNLLGQTVETLIDGPIEAGYHTVRWNAFSYSSGIYFYKLTAGNEVFTKRMTLLK